MVRCLLVDDNDDVAISSRDTSGATPRPRSKPLEARAFVDVYLRYA
jgi:hypothetical protein